MEKLIYQVANVFTSNDYRILVADFNKLLNDSFEFSDSVIYLFDEVYDTNDNFQINSYRFNKGRVYDDSISFDSFSNSIFEMIYIEKEKKQLIMPALCKYKDIFKNVFYDQLDYQQVIAFPLLDGLKVYGAYIFRFDNIVEVNTDDLELLVELLNIKFTALRTNKDLKIQSEYKDIIQSKEKIKIYYINDSIRCEGLSVSDLVIIKGNHQTLNSIERESLVFELSDRIYRQITLNVNVGYIKDITDEVDSKQKLFTDVYYDNDSKLYNKNKILLEMKDKLSYSLIKLKFNKTYLLDVKKVLFSIFSGTIISYIDEQIIIFIEETDRRKLKKVINDLEKELLKIVTLNYKIACLSYPKDIKSKDLVFKTLDDLLDQESVFFDKKAQVTNENQIISKRMIIDTIKNNKVILKFYPIINMKEVLVGYFVKHNFDLSILNDKRLELVLFKDIIERIQLLKQGVKFVVELSDDIIKNYNMINFIKELEIPKKLNKNLILKFQNGDKEFIDYLRIQNIEILREECINKLFNDDFYSNYMMMKCKYTKESNVLLDFLGQLEGKEIIKTIFITETIEDFHYLKEQQVGTLITNKFYNENEF